MNKCPIKELPNETLIAILKHVKFPLNFSLSYRRLAGITLDCQARTEWIIYQYGKMHCLFYAIKLEPSFINLSVAKNLTSRGVLSRYFLQRLFINWKETVKHFGMDKAK